MNCKDKLPLAMMDSWRKYETELQKMSPFEIKNKLIELAYEHTRKAACQFLNAGRGNPNWIAVEAREAFLLVTRFAIAECRRVFDLAEGIAGIPVPSGIVERFAEFMKYNAADPGAQLLGRTYDYFVKDKGESAEHLLFEWAEAAAGDQYPVPDRILEFCETIVHDYLVKVLCNGQAPKVPFDLFATEGGTAAMCYIFNSLQVNHLLATGDRVALMTPIFTPYIEIPELDRFKFDVVKISADGRSADGLHTWQYPDSEIDKLRDPSIKVLFVVNPSNPPSYAIDPHTVDRIVEIVRDDNPNLMIITDDVYATYVPDFVSLMARLPDNTLGVYSFSKYFGATGWRLAVVALSKKNIYDRMIAALPQDQKDDLYRRYESITLSPDKLLFIDRMVADSRMVALNHTAGLSTPQQMQMALFAASGIFDTDHKYSDRMLAMIRERLDTLWQGTGFTLPDDPLRAGYYSEIDIALWARKLYGDAFADYMKKTYDPLDFLVRLAKDTCIVLLNGGGFDGPNWSIRVSLANLNQPDYKLIGVAIEKLLAEYVREWKLAKG